MPAINRKRSILLVVDFQSRLMPAIEDGASVIRNAKRLLDAAKLLDVQVLFTEQNAKGLGGTLPGLLSGTGQIAHKMTFDACRAPDFLKMLPSGHDVVVSGCEQANKPKVFRVPGGQAPALLALLSFLRGRLATRTRRPVKIICCFEAGRDASGYTGF